MAVRVWEEIVSTAGSPGSPGSRASSGNPRGGSGFFTSVTLRRKRCMGVAHACDFYLFSEARIVERFQMNQRSPSNACFYGLRGNHPAVHTFSQELRLLTPRSGHQPTRSPLGEANKAVLWAEVGWVTGNKRFWVCPGYQTVLSSFLKLESNVYLPNCTALSQSWPPCRVPPCHPVSSISLWYLL